MALWKKKFHRAERRGKTRLTIVVSIFLQNDKDDMLMGFTENMSASGIAIATDTNIEQDKAVSLRIELPGGSNPLFVKGMVVWSRKAEVSSDPAAKKYKMGIKFTEIDPADVDMIEQYIKAQHEEYFGPERREYPRVRVMEVVHSAEEPQTSPVVGYMKDISAGGMRLGTEEELDRHATMSLQLKLPGIDIPIQVAGIIVWSSEVVAGLVFKSLYYEAGIKFTEITDRDRDKINQYVVSRGK